MECDLIKQALNFLENSSKDPGLISRDLIISYATVRAWTQHWPDEATPPIIDLLEKFSWVRELEPDRYIKQRRIALSAIARVL